MSKSQFVSFVPKTLDDNIHSRDINDDVIATLRLFIWFDLWDFDILPSPPSQTIQPRDPDTVNEELDSVLSPINLQGQTGCNCDLQPINYVYLVGITLQCSCDC
jgi:hypothetical protein